MPALHIAELKKKCPNFPTPLLDALASGIAAALEAQGHGQSVRLTVDGDFQKVFELQWEHPPLHTANSDPAEAAEAGATAIACALALELTGFSRIELAPNGDGFDYFLGYDESSPKFDPDNFLHARLEISGISKGSTNEFAQRIREKMKKSAGKDEWHLPVYVSVTEFSKPITYLKRK